MAPQQFLFFGEILSQCAQRRLGPLSSVRALRHSVPCHRNLAIEFCYLGPDRGESVPLGLGQNPPPSFSIPFHSNGFLHTSGKRPA